MGPTSSPLSLLLSLADSLPSAEAEREPRLNFLAENLAVYADRPLPAEAADLALRLTRRALLDLYSGYALGTFAPAVTLFRPRRPPPAEQLRLQERLASLTRLPPARAEIFHWANAALRGEWIPLLRQRIQRASPLTRRLSGAGLSLVQARPSQSDRTPEYEFGLAALRLVAESGSPLSDDQFAALTATLDGWVNDFPYFPEYRLRDLFTLLAPLPLLPAQRAELRARLLAWRDLERFPAERAYARRVDYVRAQTRAWGWRGPLAALMAFLARFYPPPAPPAPDEERARRDLSLRLSALIAGLAVLARQEEESLPPLLNFFADLLRQFLLALQVGGAIECEWALLDLLPAFLAHPARLESLAETLERFRFYRFSDTVLSDLAERALSLDTAALAALLDLRRRHPKHDWVWQVIEHSGGLAPLAESWLTERLASSPDPEPVEAARRLILHPRPVSPDLADALALRLMRLFEQQGSLPPEWASALAQNDEALRRLLLRLAENLSTAGEATALRPFLRLLSDALYDLPALTPHKLAAACLADPEDPLASGLPPAERLQQAADLLLLRGEEREILARLRRILPPETPDPAGIEHLRKQGDYPALRVVASRPRLIPILLEDWAPGLQTRAAAPRRLALARALASVFTPEHALPLLRDLFDLACEMYRAWHQSEYLFTELHREAGPLAREAARSLLALQPLLPEAVTLLAEILHSSDSLPESGFHELNPAFIRTDLLPSLVGKVVSPQSIPALLDLLTHPPSSAAHRRELERQAALQALSILPTLTTDQQEFLWQHGYASPDILTRALALLALGRQRPLSDKTWQTVRRLLRLSPQTRYNQRRAEIARLPHREAYFFTHPGDAFLLAGVAVSLAAEWLKSADLSPAQRADLRQSLQKAASPLYRGLEAKFSPLPSGEGTGVRALALSLCAAVRHDPADDPDWLVRPADLAYSLLAEFWKTSEVS